jgi:hypothetical protein
VPAKVVKTTPQRFYFEEIDEKHGFLEEGQEPTMIAFRPATPNDDAVRSSIIGGGKMVYEQRGDAEMVARIEVNLDEVPMATIYAIFEESNILGEDGKPALKKGMGYSQFKKVIGSLPSDYLQAFYEAALEVNPQWKSENF